MMKKKNKSQLYQMHNLCGGLYYSSLLGCPQTLTDINPLGLAKGSARLYTSHGYQVERKIVSPC